MNIDTKREELSNWIYHLDEDMLERIDELKKSMSEGVVMYTASGKGLTKEQYIAHVRNISESIDNGAKTFTSDEVRNYVLNRKS